MTKKQIENARRWVAALESGEYIQAVGCLMQVDRDRKAVGSCCLGVALDITRPNGWGAVVPMATVTVRKHRSADGDGWGMPSPNMMADEFGLEEGDYQRLATLNDDGASFATIAHEIRRTYDYKYRVTL